MCVNKHTAFTGISGILRGPRATRSPSYGRPRSSMLAFLFSVKDFILILVFGVLNSSDILPVSCSMSFPNLISPSTKNNITEGMARGEKITDYEFNQWFTGFTDAEGHFSIAISKTLKKCIF